MGDIVAVDHDISPRTEIRRSSPLETRFPEEPGEYKEAQKDNKIFRGIFYKNVAHEYNRIGLHIPEAIPEIPIHVGEVSLVMETLALFSNLPYKTREETMVRAESIGIAHDFGRIGDLIDLKGVSGEKYNSDNHCLEGVKWLEMMGFPDPYLQAARRHHEMGQEHSSISPRIADVVEHEGVKAAIEKIEADSGFLGLILPLADLSKTYIDQLGNRSEKPFIAEFNPDAHEELVKRQLEKGHFAEGSPRYKTEINGRELMMGIIGYLRYKYEINYPGAIYYAKQWWDKGLLGEDIAEKDKLQQEWERARNKVLARNNIVRFRSPQIIDYAAGGGGGK